MSDTLYVKFDQNSCQKADDCMILIEISKNFGLKSSSTFSKIYKIFYRRQMVDVKADSKAGTHNLCRKKPLVCILYVYSFHDQGSEVFLI